MARSKVSPWLLWMVMAQASFSGNCAKEPVLFWLISRVSGSIRYSMFSQMACSTSMSPLSPGQRTRMASLKIPVILPIRPLK